MRIIRAETRTIYVLAVEEAAPLARRSQGGARSFVPRKVEVPIVRLPGAGKRLGPVDVHGPLLRRDGSAGQQWAHERYWPMDWGTAPDVVQQALRELGLTSLAGLLD